MALGNDAAESVRAGVDINNIRAWLVHVSLGTTNVSAETDLDIKVKASLLAFARQL
ncbi:hypothetical protein [Tunturiibacter lichenicola]|uniref:hypothetical protein n=1 Tax=Tunturiibacter lichenicola TaxID=2051959 RepID=UPI003D9B20D4